MGIVFGYKNTEIAATLGVTPISVADCLKSELGMQSIDDRRGASAERVADHQQQVERIVEKSLSMVEDILDGEGEVGEVASANLKAKTAMDMIKKEIPDIAVTRHEGNPAYLQQFNIQNIINRGAEVDLLPRPKIIDVNAEEISPE